MPDDDLTLHTPGDDTAPTASSNAGQSGDDTAARIADLEQRLAQAEALNATLLDKQGTEQFAPPPPKEPKLIGEDWGSMTAAQAKEAGCTRTVLCSDGYYVPGA